jgi:hypothetical protein
VIAGFNTDIEFDGIVYHIQTEDKGAPSHMIMSLVYDKGTILASKRSTYDDLVELGIDEKQITDRLNRQHKLMCAAVKAGRISDLVAMTRQASAAAAKAKAEPAAIPETIGAPSIPAVPTVPRLPQQMPKPTESLQPVAPAVPIDISIVEPEPAAVFEEVIFEDLPVIDEVQVIEDIEILPDEAVAVVSELSGKERPSNNKLSLELIGDSKFKGGERKSITIMICRGTERKVVAEAQILVKVLGSAFRPVIFHARSDKNGLARIHLQLPHFSAGRAALLVRALASGEEIELRRIVTPG